MPTLSEILAKLGNSATAATGLSVDWRIQVGIDTYRLVDPASLSRALESVGLPDDQFRDRANSYRTQMGPEPGQGYLLVTLATYLKLRDVTFSLRITESGDDSRAVVIDGLRINRAEAILPTYDDQVADQSKVREDTVYLLHVEDGRGEASRREREPDTAPFPFPTGDDSRHENFNLIYEQYGEKPGEDDAVLTDPLGLAAYRPPSGSWTLGQILQHLARRAGLGALDWVGPHGGAFAADGSNDEILASQIEGARFVGMSAYDALNQLLRAHGMRLGWSLAGKAHVVPSDLGSRSQFNSVLRSLNRVRLIDHKGFDQKPSLPGKILVHFPNRDFQWHLYGWSAHSAIANVPGVPKTAIESSPAIPKCAEEAMWLFPHYVHEVDVPGGVDGTVHNVWGGIPRINVLLDGEYENNEADLDAHAALLAERHLKHVETWEEWRDYTYVGAIHYEPLAFLSGVAWYDMGDGTRTRLFNQPPELDPIVTLSGEFSGDEYLDRVRRPIHLGMDDYPGPPDVMRKHPAITRLTYARATEGVAEGRLGNFQLLYASVDTSTDPPTITWEDGDGSNDAPVVKASPFGASVNAGGRVLLHFAWQAGRGGEWIALPFGESATQPYAFALGTLVDAAACGGHQPGSQGNAPRVTNLRYLHPNGGQEWFQNDAPGPGGQGVRCNNLFGLAGLVGDTVLLHYDKDNPSLPLLTQAMHDCGGALTGVQGPAPNGCDLVFPSASVYVPRGSSPGLGATLSLDYLEVATSISFNEDDCTFYHEKTPICAFRRDWQNGPPGPVGNEGRVKIVNLSDIRKECIPIDCCPCDCSEFEASVRAYIAPPGFGPPNCNANNWQSGGQNPVPCDDQGGNACARDMCQEIVLTEIQNPGGIHACNDTACNEQRVWKGELVCTDANSKPPGILFCLTCDALNPVPHSLRLCLWPGDGAGNKWGDSNYDLGGGTPLTGAAVCGCEVFEFDMDPGGQADPLLHVGNMDFCGCTLNAACAFWVWINMFPSKGGYACGQDLLP